MIYWGNWDGGYNRATVTRARLLLLLLWAAILPCAVQAKQFAIVADKTNATSNLTAAELVKILRKLLNMTPEQAHVFVLAHRGAIIVADSDDAVLRFVSSSRGALGIVDLYSLTQDVNVLKIDGKLPVEQGYLLRGN